MKKSIIKTVVLAALMALPMFAKAQTFAGITAEQNAQNTPEGWTAVELPQLPAITSANTFNIKDYGYSRMSSFLRSSRCLTVNGNTVRLKKRREKGERR